MTEKFVSLLLGIDIDINIDIDIDIDIETPRYSLYPY
jgi:hypothetical protein